MAEAQKAQVDCEKIMNCNILPLIVILMIVPCISCNYQGKEAQNTASDLWADVLVSGGGSLTLETEVRVSSIRQSSSTGKYAVTFTMAGDYPKITGQRTITREYTHSPRQHRVGQIWTITSAFTVETRQVDDTEEYRLFKAGGAILLRAVESEQMDEDNSRLFENHVIQIEWTTDHEYIGWRMGEIHTELVENTIL